MDEHFFFHTQFKLLHHTQPFTSQVTSSFNSRRNSTNVFNLLKKKGVDNGEWPFSEKKKEDKNKVGRLSIGISHAILSGFITKQKKKKKKIALHSTQSPIYVWTSFLILILQCDLDGNLWKITAKWGKSDNGTQ